MPTEISPKADGLSPVIARPSYAFPPLATVRYRGRFLFALAFAFLAVAWFVTLTRKEPPPPLLDPLVAAGTAVASAWFAWRATIVYRATYHGVTISRAGLMIATYSWTDLREWCLDWTVDGDEHPVSWLWLRFEDGRRWVIPEPLGRDFRDLRNHLAIHFDANRLASGTPLLARWWP